MILILYLPNKQIIIFLALNSSSELILDLPTPRNFHPTFWNGIQVFSFDRSKNSAYDW